MTRKTGCWRDATHPVKTQYVVPWTDTSPIKSSVRSIFLNGKNRATAGKIETKQLVSKGIIDIRFPERKKCKKRDFFYQGGKWGTVAQRGERDTTGAGTKKKSPARTQIRTGEEKAGNGRFQARLFTSDLPHGLKVL